jgi:anion-transporting  ArsA/GET3 family ATPase
MSNRFDRLLRESNVIVCAGSGGVGKTTTSAALSVRAANIGLRVALVTIDPAKRLADALGMADGLTNEPTRIALDTAGNGELWAMMLDTRTTFDQLISRYSPNNEQAERIKSNLFYRNISGALSGTQEYMAAEKLYELHKDGRFDLVVVDTPPTRQALDFLSAPARLNRFIDHPLYRIVIAPTNVGLKAVNAMTQPVLKTIARVVGAQALEDALAFFRAFQGLDVGFHERAKEVDVVLHARTTRYIVITSAQPEPVNEATFFVDELTKQGVSAACLVVNRLQPHFPVPADTNNVPADDVPAGLAANLRALNDEADHEEIQIRVLSDRHRFVPIVRLAALPELVDPHHDTLTALGRLGSMLELPD